MKPKISGYLIVGMMSLFALASFGYGQTVPQPLTGQPAQAKPADKRDAILRELALTDEQKIQLRELNKARKPLIQAAQKNFRDAMRALDASIYADVFDEYAYGLRLADLQKAQAELQRLRFENEVNIRKILTPAQLGTFRDLRKRFAAERKLRETNGDKLPDRPIVRRMQRRQGQPLPPAVKRPVRPQ